ncbi:uncharacterized protein FOMMEDRAFT_100792 [Fomitiporia mediterranea MF3/22]|uniref:uncharacterized protein n=1 Tax=Fomitiporia mediterranea (strain MF3/22) TaxID=694068 RepID=UPI000440829A|nr:uncharacterized protein FOMMEDRAFT_100792 [Fomitiporia mediterranea MF3/22]EJD07510.1 hypothetical protein FOMMEDRAFT_100792 [Fomitiporia mediterranea MF3/22]
MPRSAFHLFSLPQELLETLTPRNLLSNDKAPSPEPVEEPVESTQTGLGSRTCNICQGAVFANVDDQRSHFRSDWHRYNVKVKLANGKAVSETEFAALLDSLEDSLSGSESSEDNPDEENESDSDAIQTLLSKAHLKSRSPSPDAIMNVPVTALTWFHSPPSTQIGIYRAVFTQGIPQSSYLSELREMQSVVPQGRKWAMFMVAGGHFAGLVVRVSRSSDVETEPPQKGKQKKPIPEMEILCHKTFHRYTTRRKQGGSQSLNDNAKGNAKSAGAQLRRYGEQALRDDIRNLISEWSEDISACERIWIRASGANRRIFMDYDGATIAKGDPRLRTFPFPTRRPTQAELSRCLMELTKVKITHFTEEELQAQDEAFLASLPKPKPQPTPAPETLQKAAEKKAAAPKLTKEEEIFRDKWMRLLDMIKKGRLEAVKSFWEREGTGLGGVDAPIPDWTEERTRTLLQLAASSRQAEVTTWLLDDQNADPTIPVPTNVPRVLPNEETQTDSSRPATPDTAPGAPNLVRTAYDISSTRAVRDAFRRSAGLRPDAWDWLGAAHIPSILSAEMEAERDNKKKERRKGLKDKIREREAREAVKEVPAEPAVAVSAPSPMDGPAKAGPQKLGGGAPNASQGLAGLTPEMRARIERERRARAAEARMKK